MHGGSSSNTNEEALPWRQENAHPVPHAVFAVVIWSQEPDRIGDAACVDQPCLIGRGSARVDDPLPRATFVRQRPKQVIPRSPFTSSSLSRCQLSLTPSGDGLEIKNLGKRRLLINGHAVHQGKVEPGDVLEVEGCLSLLIESRPKVFPESKWFTADAPFAFGQPDSVGLLGEGLQPWLLRDALARAVASRTHILLLGPSGAGKELAARWIHHLATRAHAGQRKRLIACNAATLTGNLIDAELFGNAKNYPNAGMAERAGLVGEADGGVLFLDEIAELSEELQARLLRVLDSGEYLRLGESQPRTAKFRLVGATNRPESSLKGDVLARFESRCQVSGLNERRSDIGLLIAHFLVEMAQQSPQFARFLEPATLGTRVRVAPALVTALTRHKYQFHVRELRRLLRIALANSDGDFVAFSKEVEEELVQSAPVDQPNKSTNELSVQEIQDQLTVAAGNVTEAAKRLGLKNRFVLLRLMKKLGIR